MTASRSLAWLKAMLWLYFSLIILEGALRKWVFPQYSDLLFIIRDPLVVLIYVLAWRAGHLHWRPCLVVVWVLAVLSLLFALYAEVPLLVAIFGLRTNYLHLPLIFVLGNALDRDDVRRFGLACLLSAAPITGLMLVQFNSPADAFINAGVGSREAGQLLGALGRIRPPGPFSFISGLVAYFALTGAFVLDGWLHRSADRRLAVLLSTLAVAVALPVSISRSLLFVLLVVGAFGFAAAVRDVRRLPHFLGPLVVVAAVLLSAVNTEYLQAFRTRWDEATNAGGGDFQTNVVERILGDYTQAFLVAPSAPLMGHGIGLGTVAGARLATGKNEFLLAESEWTRIVLELGPLAGFVFIGWRVWLALSLVLHSWRQFRRDGDSLAWLLAGAVFFPVLNGQWGPSTHLGFAVFGAGLCLAALKLPAEDEEAAPAAADDPAPEPAAS